MVRRECRPVTLVRCINPPSGRVGAASRTVEVIHLKIQVLWDAFRCHIGKDIDADNLNRKVSCRLRTKAGARMHAGRIQGAAVSRLKDDSEPRSPFCRALARTWRLTGVGIVKGHDPSAGFVPDGRCLRGSEVQGGLHEPRSSETVRQLRLPTMHNRIRSRALFEVGASPEKSVYYRTFC